MFYFDQKLAVVHVQNAGVFVGRNAFLQIRFLETFGDAVLLYVAVHLLCERFATFSCFSRSLPCYCYD